MNHSVLRLPGTVRNGPATHGAPTQWLSRSTLPAKCSKVDFNVWSFVKQCIGKDLTKISMPVALNEPLSFLQRVAEYMEYSELLTEASQQSDPIRRMELVLAFAVSATSSNYNRIGKPFNPLLGETYELHHNGFVLVAEQVSHHPPVSAVHVESIDYCLDSTVQFKLRFWGKSIEVQPKGFVTLKLRKHNEVFTWQHPNLTVHNVLLGKLWIEHVGQMTLTNHTSGLVCRLDFHPSGWFGQQANQVTGQLIDHGSQSGTVLRQIFGNWTRGLFSLDPKVWNERHAMGSVTSGTVELPNAPSNAVDNSKPPQIPTAECDSVAGSSLDSNPNESAHAPQFGFEIVLPEQRCLWLARPRSTDAPVYFNFTQYAMGLNELPPGLADCVHTEQNNGTANGLSTNLVRFLPPTDCRFRPDIRALEMGDIDTASQEKDRLEQKQRLATKRTSAARAPVSSAPVHPLVKLLSHERSSSSNSIPVESGASSNSSPIPGPLWFKQSTNEHTDQIEWLFTGDYWTRDWSRCPHLY